MILNPSRQLLTDSYCHSRTLSLSLAVRYGSLTLSWTDRVQETVQSIGRWTTEEYVGLVDPSLDWFKGERCSKVFSKHLLSFLIMFFLHNKPALRGLGVVAVGWSSMLQKIPPPLESLSSGENRCVMRHRNYICVDNDGRLFSNYSS